jgi:putative ABC transport system permease protein
MRIGSLFYHSFEGIAMALDSIRSNKVRAALTIMGIAVGVFVVVAMSAAVHGIQASVQRDLAAAGPTTFFVFRRGDMFEMCDGSDETCPSRRNPPLQLSELEAINRLPSINAGAAQVSGSASFRFRDRHLSSAGFDAYTHSWTDVDGGDIYPGRSFTAAENAAGSRVVIINEKMAERLFPGADPVGKVVQVNGKGFLIIGIYHSTIGFIGTPTQESGDEARAIFPMETARRELDAWMRGMNFTLKPHDHVDRDIAMDDVIATLRGKRGLRPAAPNNFAVIGQDKLFEQFSKFTGGFFLVMLVLGSVGLLVGGVGVVAIMMISVTERTREIGVRKALGATSGTILWQFLVEAATMTVAGATIGLLIGGALAALIRSLTPIEASMPAMAIVAALVAAAVSGILFGIAPAARAARLDPVEALRYE